MRAFEKSRNVSKNGTQKNICAEKNVNSRRILVKSVRQTNNLLCIICFRVAKSGTLFTRLGEKAPTKFPPPTEDMTGF